MYFSEFLALLIMTNVWEYFKQLTLIIFMLMFIFMFMVTFMFIFQDVPTKW